MHDRQLIFNPHIADQKPTNQDSCPFCDQRQLGKVLDRKDDMIWVENKFPTLEQTYQTLIIESEDHLGDISNYSQTKNRQLFHYAFEKWQSLKDGGFCSVLMYRNFGTLSGGSLRHPHLQIVGLNNLDGYESIKPENFQGLTVSEESDEMAEILVSTQPLIDFTEFDVKVSSLDKLDQLADGVQFITDYVLSDFVSGRCQSYNLFFYQFPKEIYCHIAPRFIVSPYQIGYGIHQINQSGQMEAIRSELIARLTRSI
ncbi:DUF4931 domain-containing protein [Streptococcus dentiloxodontae]